MKKKKKPDNIVWDEKTEKYNAYLLPYPSNVGAPSFTLENTDIVKFQGKNELKQVFQERFDEIKKQYQSLIEDIELNNLVYSAKFNFIPVVGHVYYLYICENKDYILSLIAPYEWNNTKIKFVNKVKLNHKSQWELIKDI